MTNIKEIAKHIKSGHPTKYDESKHIELLLEVFNRGEGVMAFCKEAFIVKDTFYTWLRKHKMFNIAYEFAKNLGGSLWENMPINREVNLVYWTSIMRNRFGYGKSKFKISSAKTAKELLQSAKEHLDRDMITIHDFNAIVNSAKMQELIDTNKEELEDKNLNIVIEVKEHENLDKLSKAEIKDLKNRKSL